MKKNTIKAFTLVEMLIVIVIIGILIAALMPRMQAAQGRARDVSRKTALSQIQSAIVVSQGDRGVWPGEGSGGLVGTGVGAISEQLKSAGMNSVPVDPLKNDDWGGLGVFNGNDDGDYGYLITARNGTDKGGFALMAKTEVEGGSNWVVCSGVGAISGDTDIANDITLCSQISRDETAGATCSNTDGICTYVNDSELRYLLVY